MCVAMVVSLLKRSVGRLRRSLVDLDHYPGLRLDDFAQAAR